MIGDDTLLRVKVLTTGGTIEKTYDEHDGALRNTQSPFDRILSTMRMPTVAIDHTAVMMKDSAEMTDADRQTITEAVAAVPAEFDAILVVHGTDTLELTGAHVQRTLPDLDRPVVLTGALRPFEFQDTDAFANVHQALLACRLLPGGVYCVIHSKVLRFPGVRKDRARLTFVRDTKCG